MVEGVYWAHGQDLKVECGRALYASSLLIARHLSPALYVRYLVGLFDARDLVQVRYDINRHLQIQSETGARTGADLLFTMER